MDRRSKLPLILEALKSSAARHRGLTQPELQIVCGLCASCVHGHIRKLHADRRVYISEWVTDVGGLKGSNYHPRYKRGKKEDAPKPPPLPKKEVDRRYRERAIESGLIEDMRAANRAHWWKKQPPRRDPLAAALFGAPA